MHAGVSDLAESECCSHLRIAQTSARGDGVGTLFSKNFAARYPACAYPCQRFVTSLVTVHA